MSAQLTGLAAEFGVVYFSGEGVNENCFHEYLEELTHKAKALGASAIITLQLVQSHFQRTSLPATAVKEAAD